MMASRAWQKKTPRGKARFEIEGDGKALSVHLDRPGFRRLLETLERLAETGEAQGFEKSGRAPARSGKATKSGPADGMDGSDLHKLVFHLDGK